MNEKVLFLGVGLVFVSPFFIKMEGWIGYTISFVGVGLGLFLMFAGLKGMGPE